MRTCTIDGLRLGEKQFNWNDKLIIFHHTDSDENIANIHIVISEPYKINSFEDAISDEENQSQGEAFEMVAMFLSCYHLSNDFNMPKIITDTWASTDLEPFKTIHDVKFSGFKSNNKTEFDNNYSIEDTHNGLKNTIPLFEKLMSIPEEHRKAVSTALIMYQSARGTNETFLKFMGLVTVLEILFTLKNDSIRKRISSRTSALFFDDESKRIELNSKLRTIYKDRSDLVHGNTISLNPRSLYFKHYTFLLSIIFELLPKYIEKISQGKTKNEIIRYLDSLFYDDSD